MIKNQRKKIIIFGIAALALIIVYFAVVMPIINNSKTDEAEIPELLDGEVLGTNNRILMMEHVEKTDIQEIEVHNSYGVYALYRGDDDEFYVRDNEGAPYSLTMLSSLVVSTGYTLSMTRVATECDNFSEYGLAESDNPAWYKLTKTDGTEHIVYVGNPIPTGAGYYAKYNGRDAVYVLDSSIGTTVLADITAFITPILSYPISSTEYYTVENFYVAKKGELFVAITYLSEEEKEETAATGVYKMLFPTDYTPSSTNYDAVLQKFVNFEGMATVAIGKTDEVMSNETLLTYGIDMEKPAYEVHYKYKGVDNYIYFSEKTSDGFYYAYSMLFNLVAIVDPANVEFLDWDIIKYVDRPVFAKNINDIAKVEIESPQISETFLLDGEGETINIKPTSTNEVFDAVDLKNFRQLYKVMLSLQMEDYTENRNTNDCMATLRITTDSGIETEYKFYPYSTRRCFYTINGEGEFYLLRDQVQKMLNDTERVLKGEPIDSEGKN